MNVSKNQQNEWVHSFTKSVHSHPSTLLVGAMMADKFIYASGVFLFVSFMATFALPSTNLDKPIVLSDSSLICHNSTDQEPQFYNISRTTITCASLKPVNLKVVFDTPLKMKKIVSLPYAVKTEWKYCPSMDQEKGSARNRIKYFQSILDFNLSAWYQYPSNIKRIGVHCMNAQNTTRNASWYINVKGEFNLTNGSNRPGTKGNYIQENSSRLCSELVLGSDSSNSKYACFFRSNGHTKTSPVQYLNCYDWTNCQQLASQTFKDTCEGAWFPTECNSVLLAKCDDRNQSYVSGIVYCNMAKKKTNVQFYLTFFQYRQRIANKCMYITMGNLSSLPASLVALSPHSHTQIGENFEKNEFAFACSAPKFLALSGFEWSAHYDNSSENEIELCNRTTFDTDDVYLEEFKCEVSPKRPSRNVTVSCTVHFQSGDVVPLTTSFAQAQKSGLPEGPSDSQSVPSPCIAGGAVACFVVVFLIIIVIISRRKIQRQYQQLLISKEEVEMFMNGRTMLDTLGRNKPQSAILLPYDVSLEVPRDKIKFEPTILGQGAFGKVIKGRIGEAVVAIKTNNKTVDGQYFRSLLSELKIMTFVGKHPNIVELVGANTEKIRKHDVYLIFEFCENGDALTYIRKRRALFGNELTDDFHAYRNVNNKVEYANSVSKKFCCEDLIRWSLEIATGMDFIASKNVYHGDLAARNILLNHQLVAKVGDFGLAKELKDYALHVQREEWPLPLKWMSIESLRDLEFSIKSDVWSYGITLWEIFSLGSTPYPGVDWNFQACKRLLEGMRMDRPEYATLSIYDILMKCWQTEPKDRPSFAEIVDLLRLELANLSMC